MIINTVKLQRDGVYQVNGNLFVSSDPGNRHYRAVQDWIAAGGVVDPAETLTEAQTRRIGEIKAEAGTIILARSPAWQQRNLIARAVRLNRRGRQQALTIDEESVLDAGEALLDWIDAVRDASNTIQADINASDNTDAVDAVVVIWPPAP